jgi:hypothetical protein
VEGSGHSIILGTKQDLHEGTERIGFEVLTAMIERNSVF